MSKNSPSREANATLGKFAKHRDKDIEKEGNDPFYIPFKADVRALKRWRKYALVLNATRRFRYTLDLNKLKHGVLISRFTAATHAVRAVQRLREAAYRAKEHGPSPDFFKIGPFQLEELMRDQQLDALQRLGGVKNLSDFLKTDLKHGIDASADEVEKRKAAFGNNHIPPKPGKSFWHFVWGACHDTLLIILMACAVVSFGTEVWSEGPKQGWYDGVSIGVAVLIVVAVTATSDYRQSLLFRDWSDVKKNIPIKVIRGGRRSKISAFDVVVGDIVTINIGDQVPADGLLVSGQTLTIDESRMTGESLPVYKDDKHPFLLSGCTVSDGYGRMLVTAVGSNTEWGQVMAMLSEDNGEETPLQMRLNGAVTFIGSVGLKVAIVVFIILFIRFFAVDFKNNKSASYAIQEIVRIFTLAVTIVVVAVPDGLPWAVTLTLAYSVREMMKDTSLVRNLVACETMGSATTVCSDKTGTLTLNKMTVAKSWVAGRLLELEEVKDIPREISETLLVCLCQNTSGSVFTLEGGEVEISGSPTESAALLWGVKIGMNYDEIKRSTSVIHVETFNSAKKRAGVVVRGPNGEIQAQWKGAAETLLELSDRWVDANSVVQLMTQDMATELLNHIEGMAAASLRCIAIAYKDLDPEQIPQDDEQIRKWEIPYQGLVFLCMIGIKDPCRPGVRDAVERCQAAGVKVRMVTGDSVNAAKAVAEECGILTGGGIVVEGRVFRNYGKEELDQILPKLDVMARSSPTDKLLLVRALKERGEVVAVTGDGTNDAPALHNADVGLSMGISGTEAAIRSSDIVILDDNFASIVKVIRWGRSVYANIQKFIQFQLTVNVTALVINFVSSISPGNVPLTAVQLLWVNLLMDTLGALALATEAPTDDLMWRAPVGRREPLITNVMWRNLLGQVFYQIAVLLTINYGGKKIFKLENHSYPDRVKNTIVFNAFVFCQVFNEVNSRRPERKNIFEGLHRNYLFMGVIAFEVVFQFLIVQFLKMFATTYPLNWYQWLICVAIGFVSWPLAFFLKCIPVREKPFFKTSGIKVEPGPETGPRNEPISPKVTESQKWGLQHRSWSNLHSKVGSIDNYQPEDQMFSKNDNSFETLVLLDIRDSVRRIERKVEQLESLRRIERKVEKIDKKLE